MPNHMLCRRNLLVLVVSMTTVVAACAITTELRAEGRDLGDLSQLASQMDEDGWRLTNDGWQHISTWNEQPFLVGSELHDVNPWSTASSHDLHPFAWTLLMVFLSLAALSYLPGSEPTKA